jgi:putative ABC transport system permease protein
MIPVSHALKNLVVRRSKSAAAVLGMALAVFLLASVLMLVNGIQQATANTGRPNRAIVLARGAIAELYSFIDKRHADLVLSDPNVERGVVELVTLLAMSKDGGDVPTNVPLRGVSDDVMSFRSEVRIVEGRPLQAGVDEVIIGKKLRGRFPEMELGETIQLAHNRPAKVVGIFEANGSMLESEIWCGIHVLGSAFNRDHEVSTITVELKSADAFAAFEKAVEENRQFGFEAVAEPEFIASQSQGSAAFISGLGILITLFFGIAAIIGAMNTMYASVDDRSREIGVLRALGFSKLAILISFLIESTLLASAGGALGAAMALATQGASFTTLNLMSWSEVTFSFTPSPAIVLGAVVAAVVMGLVGGFLPAIRAARISPLAAIRA